MVNNDSFILLEGKVNSLIYKYQEVVSERDILLEKLISLEAQVEFLLKKEEDNVSTMSIVLAEEIVKNIDDVLLFSGENLNICMDISKRFKESENEAI